MYGSSLYINCKQDNDFFIYTLVYSIGFFRVINKDTWILDRKNIYM